MDEILRKQQNRKQRTPAHLVPPAAVKGERTYGYFPSARDIRHAERREDIKREKASMNKIWNIYPTITPRTQPSSDWMSKQTVTTPCQSLEEASLTGVETPEKYEVVNIGSLIRHTDHRRNRHFFISPEWVSEEVTVKRMDKGKQTNPLNYGWI